jgi:hypothetical protein
MNSVNHPPPRAPAILSQSNDKFATAIFIQRRLYRLTRLPKAGSRRGGLDRVADAAVYPDWGGREG